MTSMPPVPDASQRDRVRPGGGLAGAGATDRSRWTGWIVFAAVLLLLGGLLRVLQGLVALFADDYYVVGSDGLPLDVGYTAWGVLHLLVGALACLIGVGLLAGNIFARGAAVVLAGFSAVANLVFLAAYPVWSLVIVAFDVVVVYSVVMHGEELDEAS